MKEKALFFYFDFLNKNISYNWKYMKLDTFASTTEKEYFGIICYQEEKFVPYKKLKTGFFIF